MNIKENFINNICSEKEENTGRISKSTDIIIGRKSTESLTPEQKRNELIGVLLVLSNTFLQALGNLLLKWTQKRYAEIYHNVPFIVIRGCAIVIVSISSATIQNERILRPNEITCKAAILARTHFNLFSVVFLYSAMWYIRVTTINIIQALQPLLITLLGFWFLKEKFHWRYIIGVVVCIIGSFIIILNEKKTDASIHIKGETTNHDSEGFMGFKKGTLIGVFFGFCNIVFNSSMQMTNKILANVRLPVNTQQFYVGLTFIVYGGIYIIITGVFEWSIGYLFWAGLQGVFTYTYNFLLFHAYKKIDLSKSAAILYARLVFVILLSNAVVGEPVFFTDIIGACFIICFMVYNICYPIKSTNIVEDKK